MGRKLIKFAEKLELNVNDEKTDYIIVSRRDWSQINGENVLKWKDVFCY